MEAHQAGRRTPRAWCQISVLLLAACALIIAAGARNSLATHFSTEVVIALASQAAHARKESGNAYFVDLSRHRLARYADTERYPFRSRFVLTEDDRRFDPHTGHDEIRTGLAKFSHWHDGLYFSSSDGSDPFTNGRSYVLRGTIPKQRVLALLQYLDAIALVGLVVLFVVQTRLEPAVQRGVARFGLPLLTAALGVAFAIQLCDTAARFAISPDSESYTWNAENPRRAIRPPGYALFMDAVSDARIVGDNIRALARQRKVNQILTDDGSEPLRKVVVGQKAVLAAALIAAFLALSRYVPLLLAATLTLGVGYFLDKSGVPIFATTAWQTVTALLLSVSLLAAVWRRYALSRVAAIAGGIAITLYPVLRMVLYLPMVPEGLDFIMSEPLTMASQLLLVGCLCSFLYTRRAVWLYLAAVAFAFSMWIRPASIFELGMILLALVAVSTTRPRPSIPVLIGGLVLSVALMQAPSLYERAVLGSQSETARLTSWALAAFALEVAQPGDVDLMPNPTAARFLNEALAERKKQLAQHNASSGPAFSRLGINMYLVALPVAQRLAGGDVFAPAVNELFYAFATPIYKAHPAELFAIFVESFRFGVTDGTRLSQGQPLWWTLVGLLLLVCLVRRPMVVVGCIVLLGHFGHVLVASVFDAPIPRYVYATEFLVVIGLSLVIVAGAGDIALFAGRSAARLSTRRRAATRPVC